jgi:hypothetical protein
MEQKSTMNDTNKFAWYLVVTPNKMFSLYDYPITRKTGLPLCDEHGRKLEQKETILYDEEAIKASPPEHCWVCEGKGRMNDLRDNTIIILLVAMLTTYQAFNALTSRTYQLTEDAKDTRFVAGCEPRDISVH